MIRNALLEGLDEARRWRKKKNTEELAKQKSIEISRGREESAL